MADFGIGVASGVAFEIVKSIVAYAKVRNRMVALAHNTKAHHKEVQINKAQAKQLSKNCETRLDQYKSNFQRVVANVEGLARSPSYDILDNSFKEFTSVLRTLEVDMEKWAKLGFWQRLAQKREMECSIQAFNRDFDGAWQVYQNHLALQSLAVTSNLGLLQARLEDTQNDAELMSNTAKTLKKYNRRISIPITTYVGMSRMEIAAEFRCSNLDEDPKLTQARRELREALESYEGPYLPHGIDSSELTLVYGQPVRTSANSRLYKGLRKGATVAIKQLWFEGYTDDLAGQIKTVFKRITHEADLWKDLNDPNIMKFLGCCRPQGELPFLVSPWMEHGDARTYLYAHPNSDSLKWPFCRMEVAAGLKYLHTFQRVGSSIPVPIVHGNLRGSHVLLDGNLNAFLSDFGISHLLNQTYPNSRPPKAQWSAPEVLSGETPRIESDIFSFASLALELITNSDPFEGIKNHLKLAASVRDGAIPPFPSQPHRGLESEGSALWNLMLNCWQFDPKERPTIEEVTVRMKEIYQGV